ncbi:MAG TPA: hypothetical protein VEJ84_16000, partial [Acidimicrobiales bacterium]|nr:hypothetical protein [Acidimicrobiales bacterium]
MSHYHLRRRARFGACVSLPASLLAAATMPSAAGAAATSNVPVTTTFPGASAPSGQWPYPNGELANTREAPGSAISSANVSSLQEAWAFKLTGAAAAGISGVGSLTAGPVVSNGVAYLQDEDANVYAVTLATGRLKWEYLA